MMASLVERVKWITFTRNNERLGERHTSLVGTEVVCHCRQLSYSDVGDVTCTTMK